LPGSLHSLAGSPRARVSGEDAPMPFRQEAEAVLEAWHEAERRLEAAPPGSDEELAAAADLIRIRDEYERLIRAARAADRPEPPPFPES
jgi:hypothetical protein